MTAERTERLLNVLIALSSPRGITRQTLRDKVPSYQECPTESSFERMFERDKDQLRSLGIQIVTISQKTADEAPAYVVRHAEQPSPTPTLTPEQLTMATVAARIFDGTDVAAEAHRAVMKLRAVSQHSRGSHTAEMSFDMDVSGLRQAVLAVTNRQALRFDYPSSTQETSQRTVQPWRVRHHRGSWYVTGWCTTREAKRTFKLSRIIGPLTLVGESGAYDIPADVAEANWDRVTDPLIGDVTVALSTDSDESFRQAWQIPATKKHHTLAADLVAWRGSRALIADVIAAAGHVRVVSPEAVVAAVAHKRAALAASHAGPTVIPESVTAQFPPEAGSQPSKRRGNADGTSRLTRLLSMVAFAHSKPGFDFDSFADHFGVSASQLVADLELLFVCGRPGHMPDDLIEAEWEDGKVFVGNADEIRSPLSLTVTERGLLTNGLAVLANELPDVAATVRSTMAALHPDQPAGDQPLDGPGDSDGGASGQISLSDVGATAESTPFLAGLQRAAADGVQVNLKYFVPSRGEVTTRVVDPLALNLHDGAWYLFGWCHKAADQRWFRLDRMMACEVTDTPRQRRKKTKQPAPLGHLEHQVPWALVRVHPSMPWVSEEVGVVVLRPGDATTDQPAWVAVQYRSKWWLRQWIIGKAGYAELVEPAAIREELQAMAGVVDSAERVIHRTDVTS